MRILFPQSDAECLVRFNLQLTHSSIKHIFLQKGKLGKHAFMKKLRLIVGDDVLRSTIHDIRG